MSFCDEMAKTIDEGEAKKKEQDIYQNAFHELAEKLQELRTKHEETQEKK